MLMSLIFNFKGMSIKKIRLLLISLIFLIGIVSYIYTTYGDLLIVFDRFETDEVETGGGRIDRLMIVGSKLLDYPLGGMNMNNKIGHAHNLWLDCGRVAGIIPLLLLFYLTCQYLYSFVRVYKLKSVNPILRLAFTFLSFIMLVGFVSEPILEGIPMFFAFFCLLFGILNEYSKGTFVKSYI